MAPRRRAAARPVRDRTAISTDISCLPPELLLAVFAHVSLAARHRSLALVCSRWAELVHSPALLASLDVTLRPARLLPRLRALVEWLAQRAVGHVRQLRLDLTAAAEEADEALDEEDEQEVTASIAAAVTLLGGSLRELSLSTNLSLPPLGSWLAPLGRLTSLELVCRQEQGEVAVNAPLRFLTGLRTLRLHAPSGNVRVRAALPPMLTSLWMRSFCLEVPSQISALRCLKDLTLVGSSDSDSFRALAALHSTLTALNLTVIDDVPECLGRLTALRSLTIHDYDDALNGAEGDWIEEALPQLQQLTAVYLFTQGLPYTLAALASLQHLETVCWSGPEHAPAPLPSGPWLRRLRHLALPCQFLSDAGSIATLSAATQLERLGVTDTWRYDCCPHTGRTLAKVHCDAEVLRIIAWAQAHANLQLLALSYMSPAMERAAAAARRARPQLRIRELQNDLDIFEPVCGYRCQEDIFSD